MPALSFEDFSAAEERESSESVRCRVNRARAFAKERFEKVSQPAHCNAELSPRDVGRFCLLEKEAEELLRDAYNSLGPFGKRARPVLRVARTIGRFGGERKGVCRPCGRSHPVAKIGPEILLTVKRWSCPFRIIILHRGWFQICSQFLPDSCGKPCEEC